MKLLLVLLLILVAVGCSQQGAGSTTPTSPERPAYHPTVTPLITPVPLILTPVSTPELLPPLPPFIDSQSSKTLALAGSILLTVNSWSDSITLLDTLSKKVIQEIEVGDDPRAIAVHGTEALVTLRGEDALALIDLNSKALSTVYPVCHMPYGVVTSGQFAYVACFADDQIVVFDLESREVISRLDVEDAPAGLALSGEWLLVTHFYSGGVTLAAISPMPYVFGTANVEPDGSLAQSIILTPDGKSAYLPLTRTGLALISLQYMQDWFPAVAVLDLTTMTGSRDRRLTLSEIDQSPANMPFDAAFSVDGKALYVALAGSDALAVVDVATGTLLARLPVGANPRGVLISDDYGYVLNMLDGSVSVFDPSHYTMMETIPVTQLPLDPQQHRGAVLFHQAADPSLSDGAISCATCHFDGGMDARTWINFRSGPRNTLALGSAGLPPYNWAGDMPELQDTIEDHILQVMLGDGLKTVDLAALADYAASFSPWRSPYREPDGTLNDSAQRGMELFMSGSPNCACHAPPSYADGRRHNVTGAAFSMEEFESFDTPTLQGLWATAPYMHDGVAQTLEEVLTRTDPIHSVGANLTPQQLQDLIMFLLSL